MHFQHSPDAPHRQSTVVLNVPKYDDELLALCDYEYLRLLNKAGAITLGWYQGVKWCSAALSWPLIRDFPRGTHSLYYKMPGDEDYSGLPVDDFTPRKKLLRFLATLRLLDPGVEHRHHFDWREVLARYQTPPSLKSYVMSRVSTGKRSSVIRKIGCTLAERGASAAEIARVLVETKAWQSKHGSNLHALNREVTRAINKGGRHEH
jgi:hypothetical protein